MDSLDAQIKALQRKKAKIAMLRNAQALVHNLKDDSEHEGICDEIRALFDQVINSEILSIQSGQRTKVATAPPQAPPELANDDRGSLPSDPPAKPIVPRPSLVDFVRQYSHLGFKKVSAETTNGETVTGRCVKVEYPHLMVQNDADGNLYEVKPETAKKLEE